MDTIDTINTDHYGGLEFFRSLETLVIPDTLDILASFEPLDNPDTLDILVSFETHDNPHIFDILASVETLDTPDTLDILASFETLNHPDTLDSLVSFETHDNLFYRGPPRKPLREPSTVNCRHIRMTIDPIFFSKFKLDHSEQVKIFFGSEYIFGAPLGAPQKC